MKVNSFIALIFSALVIVSCGGGSGSASADAVSIVVPAEPWKDITIETEETFVAATDVCPEYTIIDKTQYCLSLFAQDSEGFHILFDGKTLNGWRGYNRDDIPGRWTVDASEGAIKFSGGGQGEDQSQDGGDLIFGHKFKISSSR